MLDAETQLETAAAIDLVGVGEAAVLAWVLVLSRVAAFVGFCPLFARNQLPVMVKIGMATALSVFWFGTLPAEWIPKNPSIVCAAVLVLKEIGIGLLLALLVGFILVPARIAGSYLGQEIGLSMEPVTQTGSEQATVLASVFEIFTVLIFFGLNLHHFILMLLHHSMDSLAGKIELLNLPTQQLVAMVNRLPEYGLSMIAPIGVISFVVLVGLFFLSKAAPTMNLFSVGMPLRVGLGVLLLVLLLPVVWTSIGSYLQLMTTEIEQVIQYFT